VQIGIANPAPTANVRYTMGIKSDPDDFFQPGNAAGGGANADAPLTFLGENLFDDAVWGTCVETIFTLY
jgi:hypothetical protein